MIETRYLIVGAGQAADAAVRGIRERDRDGRVTLVGAEQHPPYKRPPLSKGLWAGGDEARIWAGTDNLDADLRLGARVVSVDPERRRALDDQGVEYAWEKLLFATGGRPRRIAGAEGVVYFRTLDDYRDLRARATEGAAVVVIGGGFVGSELAAAFSTQGCRVTMVFPEPAIAARVLPAGLADFVTDHYRERGVEVLAGETVSSVAAGARVTLGSGRVLEADAVVAGLGIEPNAELAADAGLPVENGIVVDEQGRVGGRDDVFAAGDVANFPSVPLGSRFRVEHEDHAKTHGQVVGANMAGADAPYDHLPLFYSDMFDLGYEAVGEVDARLRTVETWEEPNRKGIVAYVDDADRARGFLLWNTWGRVDAARELIRAGRPFAEAALV